MTTTTRRLPAPRSAAPLIGLLAVVLATAACAGGSPADPGTPSGAPPSSTSASDADSGQDIGTDTAEPPAPQDPAAPEGPEAAFRSWLAASRAPDVATACGLMSPELVDRMVAEMSAQGWPGITDCASMITTTAELYAAVGDVPEVEVSIREERPDATVLSVAYVGGDCGTAVMAPAGSGWVITEQSEEQC